MRIVRADPDGSFDAKTRFTIVLGPRMRRDVTMIGLMCKLTRARTLWLCLVLRPYIKGSAEIFREA